MGFLNSELYFFHITKYFHTKDSSSIFCTENSLCNYLLANYHSTKGELAAMNLAFSEFEHLLKQGGSHAGSPHPRHGGRGCGCRQPEGDGPGGPGGPMGMPGPGGPMGGHMGPGGPMMGPRGPMMGPGMGGPMMRPMMGGNWGPRPPF